MGLDEDFIAFGTDVGRSMGLDLLSSKLISILYIEPKEVSMEKLAKHTGYSLASVSGRLKRLEQLGMIEKRKKPGSKKLYFFMEKDIRVMMRKFFEMGYEREIKPAKEVIPKLLEKYNKKKLDETGRKKLGIVKNYYNQILGFEKMFKFMTTHMEDMKKVY